MKTLKVGHKHILSKDQYRVLVVKNSLAYKPDEILCKSEVEGLCGSSAWDVTIVADKGI